MPWKIVNCTKTISWATSSGWKLSCSSEMDITWANASVAISCSQRVNTNSCIAQKQTSMVNAVKITQSIRNGTSRNSFHFLGKIIEFLGVKCSGRFGQGSICLGVHNVQTSSTSLIWKAAQVSKGPSQIPLSAPCQMILRTAFTKSQKHTFKTPNKKRPYWPGSFHISISSWKTSVRDILKASHSLQRPKKLHRKAFPKLRKATWKQREIQW